MKATVRHAGPEVQSPSQAIVAKANEVIRFADAKGRTIGIKRLGVLDRARFFEMIGGDNANNPAFLSLAVPAQMTIELDGNLIGRPTSRRDLEGRMSLLDEEGIEAINKAIVENFGDGEEDPAGTDLKNAPATPV